ncbi:unnamed protein product [Discosporangium mesarthrocarpum]
MFLSDKNNIKEVLLFPAMKPSDDTVVSARQVTASKLAPQLGMVTPPPPPGTATATAVTPGAVVRGCDGLDGVDLASPAGMQKLESRLKGVRFLGGSLPGAGDMAVYPVARSALSLLRPSGSFPAVVGWLNTVGMFPPAVRVSWGAEGGAGGGGGAVAKEKVAGKGRGEGGGKKVSVEGGGGNNDDMDDLFFDNDDEASKGVGESKGPSRAEKMAAAKAAKNAKKKIDRSQVVLEVKPWEAESDLKAVYAKIAQIEVPGLVWGEAFKEVPVAFGVKKLVVSCVIEDDKVGVQDITDPIEALQDDVQSVDMTSMNRL